MSTQSLSRRVANTGLSRVAVAVAVLAAVLQANFLLEHVVQTGLPWTNSLVSALSAANQPWSWVFRVGDASAGLLLLGLLPALRRTLPGWSGRLTVGLLALFAVGLVVAALAREDCVPGMDPGCVVDALSGSPPFSQDWWHDVASTLSVTGIVVMPAPAFWALRQRGELRSAWAVLVAGLVSVVLALVESTEILFFPAVNTSVPQRVQVLLVSVQLLLLFVGRPIRRR